jgi:hypothetical protein
MAKRKLLVDINPRLDSIESATISTIYILDLCKRYPIRFLAHINQTLLLLSEDST